MKLLHQLRKCGPDVRNQHYRPNHLETTTDDTRIQYYNHGRIGIAVKMSAEERRKRHEAQMRAAQKRKAQKDSIQKQLKSKLLRKIYHIRNRRLALIRREQGTK